MCVVNNNIKFLDRVIGWEKPTEHWNNCAMLFSMSTVNGIVSRATD